MFIEIDVDSARPIFEQVTEQIKFAIAAEAVRSGEMIPSVRDLSKQSAINPNTVARTEPIGNARRVGHIRVL